MDSAATAFTTGLARARSVWTPGTSSPARIPTIAATLRTEAWSGARTRRLAAPAANTWYVGNTASPLAMPTRFGTQVRSRDALQVAVCGEETVAAMLKTTKRFLGQQRFERLSKVFWCENFAHDGEKPTTAAAAAERDVALRARA
jgi:hypothetical protein